ncbi:MAG: serine hydrolase [Bacillota bacterium]|nr:serine hydrolase [Bacillota bacterium]
MKRRLVIVGLITALILSLGATGCGSRLRRFLPGFAVPPAEKPAQPVTPPEPVPTPGPAPTPGPWPTSEPPKPPQQQPPPKKSLADYYYPKTDVWEKVSPQNLGWDAQKLRETLEFARANNSTALVVLHKGKIVDEEYWQQWGARSKANIASAAKGMMSTLIGIAQQQGKLKLDDFVSGYLGNGWSNAPLEKEQVITIRHLLTMTSGLDHRLEYEAAPGTKWLYNTLAYHKLMGVVEKATRKTINAFSAEVLFGPLGMSDSRWFTGSVTASARDMARFGLMILGRGTWAGRQIVEEAYLGAALDTSQDLNHSYGYLWWLNGKDSVVTPGVPLLVRRSLVPEAPADLVAALGMGDKKIYVVPSLDLVVVRHGTAANDATARAGTPFDSGLWKLLMGAVKK